MGIPELPLDDIIGETEIFDQDIKDYLIGNPSILEFHEAVQIKKITDRFDDVISDTISKGVNFSNILDILEETNKLDDLIRNYLSNNDYDLNDCYAEFFDILTHTDKFDDELSCLLKFDKLLVVTDIRFLATSTGAFEFPECAYDSESNDLHQISKIRLLRRIIYLIDEQDVDSSLSPRKEETQYFLRLKDFGELSLLEISKQIDLYDSNNTTLGAFMETPLIDELQAREKKEEKIRKRYQMEIEKLADQKGLLEAQLKSSKSQIKRLKRKYEESQEELEEARDLAESWKGKYKKKGKKYQQYKSTIKIVLENY